MSQPIWLARDAILALHRVSIARFGGLPGLRSDDLLESALARPRNAYHHDTERDMVELAALYAAALTRNHPFVDGNKRVAFLACGVFLEINGLTLNAAQPDAVTAMRSLSDGTIGEAEFGAWIRVNLRNRQPPGPTPPRKGRR